MYALKKKDQDPETDRSTDAEPRSSSIRLAPVKKVEDYEFRLNLPANLELDHGTLKNPVALRARIVGPVDAPVILALGGISAGADVTDNKITGAKGWWSVITGKSKTLDTTKYRILSFEFLPGEAETEEELPPVTTFDQARIAERLLDQLRIKKVHAFIGGSYGGMVGMAFATLFPRRLERLIVLNAAAAPSPTGSAYRSVQRQIVQLGLEKGCTEDCLALARQVAMITFRTAEEFNDRFANTPVQSYLEHHGQKFLNVMSAKRFLCLSDSIDRHKVNPADITVPLTLLACQEDRLVPIEDVRWLRYGVKGPVHLHEFHSIYGHDSFLKEGDVLNRVIGEALRA